MPVKSVRYIEDEHITYKWEIELTNGIIGRNIVYKGECTDYIITRECNIYRISSEKCVHRSNFNSDKNKYTNVSLCIKKGKYQNFGLHRLYASAYIPNPENKPIINHKNGKKYDNNPKNLEWSTYSENNKHAFDVGLKLPSGPSSENCNLTKHTREEAKMVCELLEAGYSPACITKLYPNLHKSFVLHIKNKKTWKDLSKDRDFSNIFIHNTFFTKEEVLTMIQLFKDGLSTTDVIRAMGWEFSELLRGRVRGIKNQATGKR